VAAREAGHEAGRVAVALKGQGGQLEPGRPAPGPVLQGGHGRRRQLGPEGGRLLGGEAQVGGAQLGELAAGPQPGQGSGGSARLASTSRSPAGRCSSRNPSEACTGRASISW
jgi:hypothetical protein